MTPSSIGPAAVSHVARTQAGDLQQYDQFQATRCTECGALIQTHRQHHAWQHNAGCSNHPLLASKAQAQQQDQQAQQPATTPAQASRDRVVATFLNPFNTAELGIVASVLWIYGMATAKAETQTEGKVSDTTNVILGLSRKAEAYSRH